MPFEINLGSFFVYMTDSPLLTTLFELSLFTPRTLNLLHKVSQIKQELGIPEIDISVQESENFQSRKLKSLENKDLQLCPEKSPDLLGPLYVKQQGIPQLQPGTKEFEKHFR